jgi:hypothetical protein
MESTEAPTSPEAPTETTMTKAPPKTTDITRRKLLLLTCSQCGRSVSTQAFEDPLHGEGWPQHKCLDYKAAPFDGCRPDPRAIQSKGAPFKD